MIENQVEDEKVVIVLSGGLDSTILTYNVVDTYGKNNVFALSFYYGQKQSRELDLAEITCKELGIKHKLIDISFLGDVVSPVCANIKGTSVSMPTIQDVLGDPQPPTEVPYRNMILNAIAFSFAQSNGCKKVFTGLQVHDAYSYWDCSQDFIDSMNNLSALNRQHQITFEAPFARSSKWEEIRLGIKLGVNFKNTLTCYNPDEDHKSCGKCPSCAERIMNFAKAGIPDPIEYSVNIDWGTLISKNKVGE